jgi:hypothetical protein
MSDDNTPSTPEQQKAFQAAIDQATGVRTAADNAAMAASMDQALADFRQQKMDALRDPSHPFHAAPARFWDDPERKMQAVRIRAGLAPDVAPKSPQQLAQEQHAAAFSMPNQINPNMGELFDNALATLKADPDRREAQAAELRKTLGPVAYSELLVSAELVLGRGKVTEELKACGPALRALHAQAKYNQAKRTGTPR